MLNTPIIYNPKLGWAIGFGLINLIMIASGGLIGWLNFESLFSMSLGCLGWGVGGLVTAFYLKRLFTTFTQKQMQVISFIWFFNYFFFLISLRMIPDFRGASLTGLMIVSLSSGLAAVFSSLLTCFIIRKVIAIKFMVLFSAAAFFSFALGTYVGLLLGSSLSQLINNIFASTLDRWFGHYLGSGLGGAFGGWIAGALGVEWPLSKINSDK